VEVHDASIPKCNSLYDCHLDPEEPIALAIAQHVTAVGANDHTVFGDIDRAAPANALQVAEAVEAIDGVLGVIGSADEGVAQAATRGTGCRGSGEQAEGATGDRKWE